MAALVIVTVAAISGVALAKRESPSKAQAASAAAASTSDLPMPEPTPGPLRRGDLRRFMIGAPSSSDKAAVPLGTHNSINLKQASSDWGDLRARDPQFRRCGLRRCVASGTGRPAEDRSAEARCGPVGGDGGGH